MRYGMGAEVLRDVNVTLAPGSFHFLTGASGAGKTTLLKLMYLALRPTRGLVHLFDRDISRTRRSEEHTSELQSLMRSSYAVFCLHTKISHMSICLYCYNN